MERPGGGKRPRPVWIVLTDLVLIGAVLVVFSLFHHVLPHRGEALSHIVDLELVPTARVDPARPSMRETPGLTPVPIAVTPAPGDFSLRFPTEDTGEGASFSYQSESLRVAVNEVRENGVTYFVADVWTKSIASFKTAFAGGQYGQGQRDRPETIAKENDAVIAVTGDYYGARSSGIVIRNGVLYRDKPYEDVCVLYLDGALETFPKEAFDLEAVVAAKAWQAWSFGPALLHEGQPVTEFTGHIREKNPRCGIGYYEPGHYCLVVVDGRQQGYSSGMTLAEFSALFYSLGCKAAYNFDGGATAAMIFQGERVNRPAESRKSSDILYFGVSGE